MNNPVLIIMAGCNGSGKSSFSNALTKGRIRDSSRFNLSFQIGRILKKNKEMIQKSILKYRENYIILIKQ